MNNINKIKISIKINKININKININKINIMINIMINTININQINNKFQIFNKINKVY